MSNMIISPLALVFNPIATTTPRAQQWGLKPPHCCAYLVLRSQQVLRNSVAVLRENKDQAQCLDFLAQSHKPSSAWP